MDNIFQKYVLGETFEAHCKKEDCISHWRTQVQIMAAEIVFSAVQDEHAISIGCTRACVYYPHGGARLWRGAGH